MNPKMEENTLLVNSNISILKRSLNRHQRNSCLSMPNSKHKN